MVLAHLTALPADFGTYFPKLTYLCLTNNHISHCPNSLGHLKELKQRLVHAFFHLSRPFPRFFCDGNQLTELPASISELQGLRELRLDRNQFQEVPLERLEQCYERMARPRIFSLLNLKELSLSSNLLQGLQPSIGQLQCLERLQLARNRLPSLPNTLGELKLLIHGSSSGRLLERASLGCKGRTSAWRRTRS